MNIRIILFTAIILFSCAKEEDREKPEWLLEKDKMIGFLIDLHVIEAKLGRLGIKRDSIDKLFEVYEKQLFSKHQINDSIYYKSYKYYLDDVKEMKEIYVAVVDSLNVREQLSKQNKAKIN